MYMTPGLLAMHIAFGVFELVAVALILYYVVTDRKWKRGGAPIEKTDDVRSARSESVAGSLFSDASTPGTKSDAPEPRQGSGGASSPEH